MQEERSEVAAKQASEKAKSPRVFGQARKPAKMFRAGLYARVSTNDQQTLPMQSRAMREYAARRGWTIAIQVREVGSGAVRRFPPGTIESRCIYLGVGRFSPSRRGSMLFPSSIRSRASVTAAILGLVALLSCQNDVTAPQSSTKVVSGHWTTEALRMPDSAAWALHDTTGAFALTTFTADTSFTVQALLPRARGPKDTLVLSLFTLSLRTTLGFCKADGSGNLSLWDTTTHDAKAAHLLQVLDSLQKKNPATWGSKTDSLAAQIRNLQKLYATLILSGDAVLKGFPAVHPVGIDSLAVIDQILSLAFDKEGDLLVGADPAEADDADCKEPLGDETRVGKRVHERFERLRCVRRGGDVREPMRVQHRRRDDNNAPRGEFG